MKIRKLHLDGALEITPAQHVDGRGRFLEWYRADLVEEELGRRIDLAQTSLTVSSRGSIRGVHFVDAPPGQVKYATCVQGAAMYVLVDLRVGSPTFGQFEQARLDDVDRRALYGPEGMGHGFCALTDDTVLVHLVSTTYDPAREHGIHPLDADVGISWPVDDLVLSERDRTAPTLAEARERDLLPRYGQCGGRENVTRS